MHVQVSIVLNQFYLNYLFDFIKQGKTSRLTADICLRLGVWMCGREPNDVSATWQHSYLRYFGFLFALFGGSGEVTSIFLFCGWYQMM